MSDIRQLSRRTVFETPWMKVHDDEVRFLDGTEGNYGVIEKVDSALIIPTHSDGRFQLVQQFRYPVGGRYWEFPKGSWEHKPESSIEIVAAGELEEETGYKPNLLEKIGVIFLASSFASHRCHIFTATGLRRGRNSRESEEQDMITSAFCRDEIIEMIGSGQIRDASTIAAMTLLAMQNKCLPNTI